MTHFHTFEGVSSCRRRGIALAWVLAVLAAVSVMMAVISAEFLAGRRVLDRRQNQVQSAWLARAGVELAAGHLLNDPAGYTGESLELIPGSQVRIEVKTEPSTPDTFVVTSEARYPKDGPEAVVRSVTRRFRRTTEKDRTRLEVVGTEAPAKDATP